MEYLRGLHLSWTKIAQILGISRSTLYRRLDDEELSQAATYTTISDAEIDRLMSLIKHNHPNDGERLVAGHLTRRGIIIPRARMRASIHRIDPINTAIRRSVTVRRRVYNVQGPNALWHIDGNHKLIRWRFVIHGGIDGFSRTVVYLRCRDNNEANTVLSSFVAAVQNHGIPSKIRSDLGGENVDVWQYMIEQQSCMSAVITGSSTHNERIERLWRDVNRCVGVLFHDTFRQLEDDEHLDCLNEVDVFCLHFVFLPRINSALESFIEAWNNHPVSTARAWTPNQLFIQGALEQHMVPNMPTTPQSPPGGLRHGPRHRNHVQVPLLRFAPCTVLRQQLDTVDPLGPSDDFGANIYLRVITSVGQHLANGCANCV